MWAIGAKLYYVLVKYFVLYIWGINYFVEKIM